MPGLTHLQTAQPVTFGHHLLAYVEMAARDRGRFADARERLNESPLGAAALAGTSFDLDRDMTAKALGFDRPAANSLDAVSDRDFVMETLAAASIAAVHLSRLAEEIVIWTSPLTALVKLSDKFTTGSSIMPQKRNPDAAELVRAKTGRIIGAQTALLIVMKGLPLAYAKDMQEDKEGAMDALGALSLSIAAMTGMVADMEPDVARMKKAAGEGYATATDLADWLVRTLKMPFREAHHATGRIVAKAADAGRAAAPAAARRHARDRAANRRRRVFRALGDAIGEKPRQLRRHRAEKRARAGEEMAAQAGKREILHFALIAVLRSARNEPRSAFALRLALAGALVAALGLAACGRKGPLDPPPGASLEGEPQANLPDLMSDKGKTPPAQRRAGAEKTQSPRRSAQLRRAIHASLCLSQRCAARRGGQSRHARGQRSARRSIAIRRRR